MQNEEWKAWKGQGKRKKRTRKYPLRNGLKVYLVVCQVGLVCLYFFLETDCEETRRLGLLDVFVCLCVYLGSGEQHDKD